MIPVQISYRGMNHSPALDTVIQEEVDGLEPFGSRITRCHVVVDQPHRHHRKGRQFHVRLELSTPGHVLAFEHAHERSEEHANAQLAVRDAFDAARRQLLKTLERMRDPRG